jgi:crotonobetainyl-CoA:carnitine CoA-transferase CaiB-like acyl-CoA transferase
MSLLHGVRVLDLSRILAGPWATQMLADLGAEVIKVEKAGEGDDTRRWGPPYLTDAAGQPSAESAYFLSCNRGKQSLALDFTTAAGQTVLRDLIPHCDVLVENYKVAGLKKYGLDYDSVVKLNPRLIYCSITGFGQTGPDAGKAGYDAMVQARGGLMSMTGERDGDPVKVGVAVADLMTGMYAVAGITAALYRREKNGQGEYIDLALLDSQVAWLANQGMNYLVGGITPQREGSAHPNIVPYQSFPARDGDFMLAVGNDNQFRKFCVIAGCSELADDVRFASNAMRVKHREILVPMLRQITITRDRADWLSELENAGVPVGPINTLAQVFNDPQVQARNGVVHLPHSSGVSVPHLANPLKLRNHPIQYTQSAPLCGEHSDVIIKAFSRSLA